MSSAPPIPRDIPVNQIIVTTVETIRNIALMQLLVQHQKALMVIGPTGTGKSIYVTVIMKLLKLVLFKTDNQLFSKNLGLSVKEK